MRFLVLYSSIQSDRIQSLILEFDQPHMHPKMADYRYFFNDLKGELKSSSQTLSRSDSYDTEKASRGVIDSTGKQDVVSRGN